MLNALDRTDKAAAPWLNHDPGNDELAEQVSLTTSPCWRRVEILEQQGLITGYQAIIPLSNWGTASRPLSVS